MAGRGLWDLFRPRKPDPDPLPGEGGAKLPKGPTGATGYPGSTYSTRTFKGASPRAVKIDVPHLGGINTELSGTEQVRQWSYRGDEQDPIAAAQSPRATPGVGTPQPAATVEWQQTPGTLAGGPLMRTQLGLNDTAGGEPGRKAAAVARAPANDTRDTTALWSSPEANPVVSTGVPGSANVRNSYAQRYKNPGGIEHTYKSAPRADQATNVGGDFGGAGRGPISTDVTVQTRNLMFGGGNQLGLPAMRQMPYNGRGDGARGAILNGTRYYATGQAGQFVNAGQGEYGISRARGRKRPTASFAEPAPWTGNFYDTTEGLQAGASSQAPDGIYVSPTAGRAGNSTGRTG